MSASDAKESIGKGGSLKDRMAALQGIGAFGGPAPSKPPPPTGEKPKWKPPPQVSVAQPIKGSDEEGDEESTTMRSPPIYALGERVAHPSPREGDVEPTADDAADGEETRENIQEQEHGGEQDPAEEDRQRRAAIAARMARLGGARVGMGPPTFGRKPDVKKAQEQKPGETQRAADAEGKFTFFDRLSAHVSCVCIVNNII